ncbi:unnamed protein product, partial [Candidula unifasciata]
VLSAAGRGADQELYILAPCQPVNKNFPHPGNCHGYLTCATWGLWPMDCPWVLVFDEKTGNCEWPYLVPRCRENPPITACNPNPCVNGTCALTTDSKLGYQCICNTGFIGPLCSTVSLYLPMTDDFCNPNPCTHGRCMSDSSGFSCDCRGSGYEGVFCDIPIPLNCPTHQCPVDAPRYNYPDWTDLNCASYYNCERGTLSQRLCPAGQKFDVITTVCKQYSDPEAIFCEYFRN